VVLAVIRVGGERHATPAVAPAGRQALASQLAVLRRPQTRADKVPLSREPRVAVLFKSARGRYETTPVTLLPALTRVIATGPRGHQVYLVVGRTGQGGYLLSTLVTFSNKLGRAALPELLLQGTLTPAQLAVPHLAGTIWFNGRRMSFLDVVPDRVARVRWVFTDLRSKRRFTVALTPAGNVVRATFAVSAALALTEASWYAADGRLIGSYAAKPPHAPAVSVPVRCPSGARPAPGCRPPRR
jgi:hypothetical protein